MNKFSRILKAICIVIAIGALFWALLLHLDGKNKTKSYLTSPNGIKIPITIANTSFLREKGLSGTSNLAPNTGKLFIFDTPGRYGFWMKDMNYPIDIVWIDQGSNIVGVENNIDPKTYPKAFYPPKDVVFVLEVNAYDAERFGLSTGKNITIPKTFNF